MKFASVILDVAIDKPLDYSIPESLVGHVQRGMRVEVPLRGGLQSGYVYALKEQPDFARTKPIHRLMSDGELLPAELFDLALWMARYYCAPLRQVFKAILPAPIRKETRIKEQLFVRRAKSRDELNALCIELRLKAPTQAAVLDVMLLASGGMLLTELLEATQGSRASVDALVKKKALIVETVAIDRSLLADDDYFPTKPKKLNDEQQVALSRICSSLTKQIFEVHLLYGVTGSGKTEVYLQAIEQTLQLGKGAIMLVPEISLTGQTIERFRSRFEGTIAILHHRLSPGERFDAWHKIRRGDARIVIGARSAVFSPISNLGLVIVDEEHEGSYKQSEEAPCYNARDVAVMRGKLAGASVILGSATPSLESFYNAQAGKYTLSTLLQRASQAQMPTVQVVDMRREYTKAQGYTNFSEALIEGIKERLPRGEQVILFLNRRGYHTALVCQACSKAVRCHQCDIALTFHKGDNCLTCHLCGDKVSPLPRSCPHCKEADLMKFKGAGTEQIERSLHALLPGVRTLRIDADTTRHKGSHQQLLRAFGTGKADVLIGTQMVAKGLHFPMVTLVGVLQADAALQLPDFRAAETSFQLITQVAGRAGRGAQAGEVIIQTSMPESSTIQHAARQDYDSFYSEEIPSRELFGYPPFGQMAEISLSGPNDRATLESAELLRQQLVAVLPADFDVHAVVPSIYTKVKNRFYYQFVVRGRAIYPLSTAFQKVQSSLRLAREIKVLIDINPR
jgi:primosomal protein N' (replication factor Y)